jgi:ubiquitin-conjugating enzyme E2 Q
VTRATQVNTSVQAPVASTGQTSVATPTPTPPPMAAMEMMVYNQNFDELNEQHKVESMIMLLETIPSITEMRTYLKQQKHLSEPSLQTWTDRISPAALGLLRWIIASNRSSIVQVDISLGQEDSENLMKKSKPDERVSNMDGYVQFRFAQGAPDKEHRFHKALEETQDRHNKDYPTLFAWHGSGLENWHSIIRSGLDFKDTLNGRACGHGVYHSLEYTTSRTYSREHSVVSLQIVSSMATTKNFRPQHGRAPSSR